MMKKRIIVLIIVVATIINLIVGGLLFIDIQIMQTPETTITIDVIEINA